MNDFVSCRVGPETKRLAHREFTIDDADVAFALNSNPDVMRYTGDDSLASVEDAKEFIRHYPDFDRYGYGRWACVLKETRTVIGFCGLKYLPDMGEVDIGYRFLPQYWGRGLATEACSACLEFGFGTLGLSRIVAFVMPGNIASVRVLEKAGMQFEAEFDYDGISTLRYANNRSECK
jgi:RimJ/RimL family protein N-acetyltransferase